MQKYGMGDSIADLEVSIKGGKVLIGQSVDGSVLQASPSRRGSAHRKNSDMSSQKN